MGHETQTYRYRVDAADLIVWVDRLWLAFAKENGAPELSEEFVLGRSLWDFVAGDETRRLFSEIHSRVRSSHHRVVLPFRCDSPSLQRHMRLTITEEADGRLMYESVMLRAVPQRTLDILDSSRTRSAGLLTMCSCCKRALLEPLGWLEVEDVSARLRVFETREAPQLRYSICPDCTDAMNNSSGNGNAA